MDRGPAKRRAVAVVALYSWLHGGCFFVAEKRHRHIYESVQVGQSAATLDAKFERPADCLYQVAELEVRFYVCPGTNTQSRCQSERGQRRAWTDLPRDYVAAAFVVGKDQRILGKELVGEGPMLRLDGVQLPEGGVHVGIGADQLRRP